MSIILRFELYRSTSLFLCASFFSSLSYFRSFIPLVCRFLCESGAFQIHTYATSLLLLYATSIDSSKKERRKKVPIEIIYLHWSFSRHELSQYFCIHIFYHCLHWSRIHSLFFIIPPAHTRIHHFIARQFCVFWLYYHCPTALLAIEKKEAFTSNRRHWHTPILYALYYRYSYIWVFLVTFHRFNNNIFHHSSILIDMQCIMDNKKTTEFDN